MEEQPRRRLDRAGRGQRCRRGAFRRGRFRARLGHVHQALDPLAQLSGHDLHALAELAGEELGLTARRLAHRARVTRVGEERDGRQRHDRQEEEARRSGEGADSFKRSLPRNDAYRARRFAATRAGFSMTALAAFFFPVLTRSRL